MSVSWNFIFDNYCIFVLVLVKVFNARILLYYHIDHVYLVRLPIREVNFNFMFKSKIYENQKHV